MDKETKTCPYCGEEILTKAIKCKHCGELLENNSFQQINNDKKKCPFCAELIPKDATFCDICESSLNENTTNETPKIEYTNKDSHKASSAYPETPNDLKKWNWGSFLTTWIWGIANNSYLTFLSLIPGFGLIWAFVCGFKGNEWAWQNKKWANVEEFNRIQRKWAIFGSIIISTILIFSIIMLVISMTVQTTETTNLSNGVRIVEKEDDATIVKKAVETYHKEHNKEMAKEYGVSEKCYADYQKIIELEGEVNDNNFPCSPKENQTIKSYLKQMEEEASQREYALDDNDEPIWTNGCMPKSLVLKGVSIMCFEKANMHDNSKCTPEQLDTIKEFYKNNQEIDWEKESFEY